MNFPKPHPPKLACVIIEEVIPEPVLPKPKPVFIRKPHLVDYPFWDNEGLKALKESLPKAESNRRPRRK